MKAVAAPLIQKRPTQREVAQRAGVSQATVSHVLSGGPDSVRIPSSTRQRVLDAMQQLGYVPNVAAQRLAGGRNRILGVFTYERVFPSSTRDFFWPFLEGIEEAAAQHDYDLLLHTRPAAPNGARPLYRNGSSRLKLADGTLMLGLLDDGRRRDLARLIHEGHPVVFIGRRDLPGAALLYVTAGYAAATVQALSALLERGHRRTLYLGAAESNESATDREEGYLDVLRAHSAFGESVSGEVARQDHLDEAFVAYHLHRGVTGVLFENERLTSQWLRLASGLGYHWPHDYAFALLGDPLYYTEMPSGWAHYRVPRLEMGRQATTLLSSMLEGETPSSLSLACDWVEAESLGGHK